MAAKILSEDLQEALAGADEVLAANQEDQWLQGVRYGGTSRRIWVVELKEEGPLAKLGPAAFRTRQMAMLRLIAKGRSDLAKSLREKVDHLVLLGTDQRWTYGRVTKLPLDLRPLEGLRLKRLELMNSSGVTWPQGGLPGLESLVLQDAACDELPLAPDLQSLSLSATGTTRLDLSGVPKLTTLALAVSELVAVEGLERTGLRELRLQRGTKLRLRAPATLRVLHWSGNAGAVDLDGAPELEEVHLADADLQDLGLLSHCQRLHHLDLRNLSQLRTLEGLHLGALTRLDVNSAPLLSSLGALAGAPHLTQLTAYNLPALQRLNDLAPGLPALEALHVGRAVALHSLKGLGDCPRLRRLDVTHCPALALATGLGACSELEHVRLYHCSKDVGLDLSGLEGASPKRLQLTGTRVGKTKIPESLWPVVQPASIVSKRSKRTTSDKPAPKAAKGAARGQAARLKRLLMSRDLDRIDQAAELVGILGEEVSCAISHGCSLKRDAPAEESLPRTARGVPPGWEPTWDRLVPNSLLDHADIVMPFRGHAMRVLAAAGAAPELAQARSLVFVGRTKRYGGLVPVRLGPVSELPSLERVGVYYGSELQDIEAAEGLRQLCVFEVGGVEWVADLAGPRELVLHSSGSLKGIGSAPGLAKLERLVVTGWREVPVEAADLGRLRALRSLHLARAGSLDGAAAEALAGLPLLDSVDLEYHSLPDIRALGRPGLKHLGLNLGSQHMPWVNGLGLESLRLYHHTELGDLSGLAPGPKRLSVWGGRGPLALGSVGCKDTVEELELRCNLVRSRVDELLKWPSLRKVTLSRRLATPALVKRFEVQTW